MKATMYVRKTVEIVSVIIDVKMRYVGDSEDDDVPTDFPMLNGDHWKVKVGVDTGIIEGWPKGREQYLHTKVCDAGLYTLIDDSGDVVSVRDGYVPNSLVPGDYGDYIIMNIDGDGKIKEWPENPCVDEFFDDDEH